MKSSLCCDPQGCPRTPLPYCLIFLAPCFSLPCSPRFSGLFASALHTGTLQSNLCPDWMVFPLDTVGPALSLPLEVSPTSPSQGGVLCHPWGMWIPAPTPASFTLFFLTFTVQILDYFSWLFCLLLVPALMQALLGEEFVSVLLIFIATFNPVPGMEQVLIKCLLNEWMQLISV